MDTKNYGLENVFPFKQGAILGIYVRFQGGNISHFKGKLGKSLTQKTGRCFLLLVPRKCIFSEKMFEKLPDISIPIIWWLEDGEKGSVFGSSGW